VLSVLNIAAAVVLSRSTQKEGCINVHRGMKRGEKKLVGRGR
jgi:hypothetical protein